MRANYEMMSADFKSVLSLYVNVEVYFIDCCSLFECVLTYFVKIVTV